MGWREALWRHLRRATGLRRSATRRLRLPPWFGGVRSRARAELWRFRRQVGAVAFPHSAYVPFLVVCCARTGSNYLIGLLGSHPNVLVPLPPGELFAHFALLDAPRARRRPIAYLEREVYGSYSPRIRAVGFKLMYHQARCEDPALADPELLCLPKAERARLERIWGYLAARPEIRVIHLTRANPLRSVVSTRVALESGRWVSERGAQGPAHAVRVEPVDVLLELERTDAQKRRFLDLFGGHPMLDLSYEELTTRTRSASEAVQRFLELPPARLSSSLRRQNPFPLRELVLNYADLRAALTGTRWERCLED